MFWSNDTQGLENLEDGWAKHANDLLILVMIPYDGISRDFAKASLKGKGRYVEIVSGRNFITIEISPLQFGLRLNIALA